MSYHFLESAVDNTAPVVPLSPNEGLDRFLIQMNFGWNRVETSRYVQFVHTGIFL